MVFSPWSPRGINMISTPNIVLYQYLISAFDVTDISSHIIVYWLNNGISNTNVVRATNHIMAKLILWRSLYIPESTWWSSINLRCVVQAPIYVVGTLIIGIDFFPYPRLRDINVHLRQLLLGAPWTLPRWFYGEFFTYWDLSGINILPIDLRCFPETRSMLLPRWRRLLRRLRCINVDLTQPLFVALYTLRLQ